MLEPVWEGCLRADTAWHERTQTPLLAWSAQARGFFAGRPEDDELRASWLSPANVERRRAGRTARAPDERLPVTVALAWVLAQPFPVRPWSGHVTRPSSTPAWRRSRSRSRTTTAAGSRPKRRPAETIAPSATGSRGRFAGERGGYPSRMVRDTLGRPLRDLRISVTDRCNFRCTYCMPKTVFGRDYEFLPREELLTFEEIARVAALFAGSASRRSG